MLGVIWVGLVNRFLLDFNAIFLGEIICKNLVMINERIDKFSISFSFICKKKVNIKTYISELYTKDQKASILYFFKNISSILTPKAFLPALSFSSINLSFLISAFSFP